MSSAGSVEFNTNAQQYYIVKWKFNPLPDGPVKFVMDVPLDSIVLGVEKDEEYGTVLSILTKDDESREERLFFVQAKSNSTFNAFFVKYVGSYTGIDGSSCYVFQTFE